METKWNIVHDCDLEDGTPTEWSLKVTDDKFYWIDENSLDVDVWHVLTEEFMALRQTAILADLTKTDIEDVFYNNADKLFGNVK